jgi:hypothetical protein
MRFPIGKEPSSELMALLVRAELDITTIETRLDGQQFIPIPSGNPLYCIDHFPSDSDSDKDSEDLTKSLDSKEACQLCYNGMGILYSRYSKYNKEYSCYISTPRMLEAAFMPNPTFPQISHFIWLGHKSLPLQYALNMLVFIKENPTYQVNLWVNPEFFSSPESPSYKIFAMLGIHGIQLRNYEELRGVSEDGRLNDLISRAGELHLTKPVISSDILRLLVLHFEGGFYFDTDTVFKKPLPSDPIKCLRKCTKEEVYSYRTFIIDERHEDDRWSVNQTCIVNSFLASVSYSKEALSLLEKMHTNLSKYSVDEMEKWNVSTVISKTGPELLYTLGGGPFVEDGALVVIKERALEIHAETFHYSRKHYPALLDFKYHMFDGAWYDADKANLKNRDMAKGVAMAGFLLWRKTGFADTESLKKGNFEPRVDFDDLSKETPACSIM